MEEYISKKEVLELIDSTLDREIVSEYIHELKGFWCDTESGEESWIPVEERLPDELCVRVLTCDAKGNIHIMTHYREFDDPFCIGPNDPMYYQPVAWMPLPKPYAEEE